LTKPIPISNSLADHEEALERTAKEIGRSKNRRAVFEAIYGRGSLPKTIEKLVETTNLDNQVVRNEANRLANAGIIGREKISGGKVAFSKLQNVVSLKARVLKLLDNPKKIADIPTKRKVALTVSSATQTIKVEYPSNFVKTTRLTIDDITSFEVVKNIEFTGEQLLEISEDQFKKGLQSIIGEEAVFKDWGGETSDLMTTRVLYKNNRIDAAFALKGPGLKRKLVPGSMGKNGDQAQRLFNEAAKLFIVQHWREIDPSVDRLIEMLAIAKSAITGSEIFYCIIDGNDSARIVEAYFDHFTT